MGRGVSKLDNNRGRLIAIGDIHGHRLALEKLLDLIQPQAEDQIVTLGDYINRGPDSRGVLEILLTLGRDCRHIPILGNHEEMMIDSRHDLTAESRWMTCGGDDTLDSYGRLATIHDIPVAHWEFLYRCVPYFETDRFLFTHANYCWYSRPEDQPSDLLRWIGIDQQIPRPLESGKKVVVGHTPGEIRDFGFCLCLDTGCGFGGVLTAMELNEGTIWQVTEEGLVTIEK